MAVAAVDPEAGTLVSLAGVREQLGGHAEAFVAEMDSMSPREVAATVAAVEEISKVVEFFQLAGAWAVEKADIARVGERDGLFGDREESPASAGVAVRGPAGAGAALNNANAPGDAEAALDNADAAAGAEAAPDKASADAGPVGSSPAVAGPEAVVRWADPADSFRAAAAGEQGEPKGKGAAAGRGTEFRTNAEYLRARLGIGAGEAKRRIRTGKAVLAGRLPSGEPGSVVLPVLGRALAEGKVAGRAASMITDAVARVRPGAGLKTAAEMEQALVAQAVEADQDILGRVARMWEAAADADGSEPSEAALRAKQGVFYRGRRGGLHYFTLAADDAQYQALATVMNTATNPRLSGENITSGNGTGCHGQDSLSAAGMSESFSHGAGAESKVPEGKSVAGGEDGRTPGRAQERGHAGDRAPDIPAAGSVPGSATFLPGPAEATGAAVFADGASDPQAEDLDSRTFAQKQLAGLVAGCVVALAADRLPATGGHRAQIMVTTGYRELAGELSGPAHPVFGSPVSAKTVRKLACDAAILPAVLGAKGEVLDLGRASRFFTAAVRKALGVRDRGCAFPGCTMPVVWCEAHHIVPWWAGGRTDLNNGVLLCLFHHDLVEQGDWKIVVEAAIPWFIPPAYIDPQRRKRRNRYWHTNLPYGAIPGNEPRTRSSDERDPASSDERRPTSQ